MEKIKVLIIDIDREFYEKLKNEIEESNDIKVISYCDDGKEAIEKIYLTRPDVILMDNILNTWDGIEVLDYLKFKKITNASIIVLSSIYNEKIRDMIIARGAKCVLGKTYSKNKLLNMIRRFYKREQSKKSECDDRADSILITVPPMSITVFSYTKAAAGRAVNKKTATKKTAEKKVTEKKTAEKIVAAVKETEKKTAEKKSSEKVTSIKAASEKKAAAKKTTAKQGTGKQATPKAELEMAAASEEKVTKTAEKAPKKSLKEELEAKIAESAKAEEERKNKTTGRKPAAKSRRNKQQEK